MGWVQSIIHKEAAQKAVGILIIPYQASSFLFLL